MKMNTDPEWLRRKAEQEDGCIVSAGAHEMTPEEQAAIERVEKSERYADELMGSYQSNTDPGEKVFCENQAERFKIEAAALRTVLRLAKRPEALGKVEWEEAQGSPICEECNIEMHPYDDPNKTGLSGWGCDSCGWGEDDS